MSLASLANRRASPLHMFGTALLPLVVAFQGACVESDCQVVTFEVDDGADGTFDSRTDYAYDTYRNPILQVTDADMNGTADYWSESSYNAKRQLEVADRHSKVGGLLYSETFDYDANGNLDFEERDYNGNGVTNSTMTYAHDVHGKILSEAWDDPCSCPALSLLDIALFLALPAVLAIFCWVLSHLYGLLAARRFHARQKELAAWPRPLPVCRVVKPWRATPRLLP
jgi:hypothetical protein